MDVYDCGTVACRRRQRQRVVLVRTVVECVVVWLVNSVSLVAVVSVLDRPCGDRWEVVEEVLVGACAGPCLRRFRRWWWPGCRQGLAGCRHQGHNQWLAVQDLLDEVVVNVSDWCTRTGPNRSLQTLRLRRAV